MGEHPPPVAAALGGFYQGQVSKTLVSTNERIVDFSFSREYRAFAARTIRCIRYTWINTNLRWLCTGLVMDP